MACAQGAQSTFYTKAGTGTPDYTTGTIERFEFVREGVRRRNSIMVPDGIRGTRSESSERARFGVNVIGGPIHMHADSVMLDAWLPRILGANESTNSFALAETLPAFGCLFDRVTEKFEYRDCYVNRALFHGVAGPGVGLLDLTVDIMAQSEATGTALPSGVSLSVSAASSPYTHYEGVHTFAGSTREVKEIWIMIHNHLRPRWVNSLNATALCPTRRTVAVRARLPYTSDTKNLYAQAVGGAAGTSVFTSAAGDFSTTFTYGRLQAPAESPVVRGKTEIDIIVDAVARSVSTTKELVVTNVSS